MKTTTLIGLVSGITALVFVGASAIAYGSAKEGIKVYKALTSIANGE